MVLLVVVVVAVLSSRPVCHAVPLCGCVCVGVLGRAHPAPAVLAGPRACVVPGSMHGARKMELG